MKNSAKNSVIEAKQVVSDLIFKVLTEQLCVREAIKLFPLDEYNASIQCAWHALVHYESDEELRKNDPEYAQEQDDYLEMIAFILRDGNDIPQNIIKSYDKYHDSALIPKSNKLSSLIKTLCKFIT
jgi:hypothetical protein